MAQDQEKRWIVKEREGKIWGPYTTAQILEQIDRGYYVGGEQVATFPGGQWIAISKTPEFYDRLLDALAMEGKRSAREEPDSDDFRHEVTERIDVTPDASSETDPKTAGMNPSAAGAGTKTNTKTGSIRVTTQTKTEPRTRITTQTGTSSTGRGPVIELTDLKDLEAKEKRFSRAQLMDRLPVILITVAVLLGLTVLFFGGDSSHSDGTRVHLLAPRKGLAEIPDTKATEKFQRAVRAFQDDKFSSYQRAQNELVEIAEGMSSDPAVAGKNAEHLATLCLTYRELWPYSFQDSHDLKTVSTVMQEAKRLDPGGRAGATCEVVDLILSGRAGDARSLTENMLVEESQTPVLFEIRGDLFSYVKDYQNAATYLEQARALWPAWQKISIEEARAKVETQKFSEAADLYHSVLAKVPTHPVAKIELGLLEAFTFQHPDNGLALMRTALDGDERMPRNVESSGDLGMAKIYEGKNLTSKAAQYAAKAFRVDPANLEAKVMVERLHGKVSEPGPKEAQGLISLGDQYFGQGDYFAAQAQYKTAFEADPKSGMSAMKAARCLWALNQSRDAIEWMKKAVDADPQLTAAYTYLAEYYARRYDFGSATQILSKIQRLQPNSYEVYRGFANVELIRNDFTGALQYGQRALKLYETDIDTYLIMTKAELGLAKYADAERFASRAIELDFNSTEAQSLYAKSEAGLRGVNAGIAYVQKLIDRYVVTKGQQVPQAAVEYRITLGEIYLADERYHAAEEAFQQAISLDPDNKRALIDLAKSLQAQNLQQRALEAFLRAAVLDPSDADPIYYSGMLYADVGKTAEALKQFDRVLKINPRYPRGHVALGQMYLRQGDATNALAEAMKEREINPGIRDSYLLAAQANFALKRYANCAAEYQLAVKGQRNADIMVKMARCYRLSGALDSAESMLREARAIESGNPDLYKEQGAIFHMKGMADEAIAAYDTYLKLVPSAPDRAEIENRIRRVRAGDLDVKE